MSEISSPEKTTKLEQEAKPQRTRVLYHGTGLDRIRGLQSIGLLGRGKRTTLTSNIANAKNYAVEKSLEPAVSIWYPERGDVSGSAVFFNLKGGVFDARESADILNKLDESSLTEIEAERMKIAIKNSNKRLPVNRLKAIIKIDPDTGKIIDDFESLLKEEGLVLYTQKRDALVAKAVTFLNESPVVYLDPNLLIPQLAKDIVESDIESQLLSASEDLRYHSLRTPSEAKEYWEDHWGTKLSTIVFQEPHYERYRQMLLNRHIQGL